MLHRKSRTKLRQRLYEILEGGLQADRATHLVNEFLVALIVINLAAMTLESVPSLAARYAAWFDAIEAVSLVAFTIEYLLRIWVAVEHAPFRKRRRWATRIRYMTSPSGIVDLLAVLPFWLGFLVPVDLRVLLVMRVIRFFKIARYSTGMRSLFEAVYAERRALLASFVILIAVALTAASIMYLAERDVQPEKFGTIPDALWWAIVTLGTVGYGDVVPMTPLGRLVASFTIFGGLIMVALPVGIVATAFANVIHRRDFVVTWTMVSRVPLFSGCNASEIADVMKLLHARVAEPGTVIARRGEAAHSMYFITSGEVEVELGERQVRLGPGQFFGEIAVLRSSQRTATVIAVSRVNLLALDAHDLHTLMGRSPAIAKGIRATASERLGEAITTHGDLTTTEITGSGQ